MTQEMSPGQTIASRFRLERKLGEGGIGEVWAATHLLTRKRVALKFLKSESRENAAIVQRFMREARAASAVRHPNIVQVHDVVSGQDGSLAIVMDFLDGEDLGQLLERRGRLPVHETAQILLPVLRAIECMHDAGIVHRDLKPENVFLDVRADGRREPKVLDFGIAKVAALDADDIAALKLTNTGVVMGTPYYMSPEQVFGQRDVDRRSDVWAVGVIVYQCLAGMRPFDGDNYGQLFKAIAVDPIPALEHILPDLPSSLAHSVSEMLVRDASHRATSLRGLIAALEQALTATVGDLAAAGGASSLSSLPVATAHSESVPGLHHRRRRSPLYAAVAVVTAGGLLWWVRSGDPASAEDVRPELALSAPSVAGRLPPPPALPEEANRAAPSPAPAAAPPPSSPAALVSSLPIPRVSSAARRASQAASRTAAPAASHNPQTLPGRIIGDSPF